MNKKILNLGTLLVFIFSCNVNTSNSNVDVKPTTPVSSNISTSPTVTPSVQITTNPTNIKTPSPSVSPTIEVKTSPIAIPTITPTPTSIATPYVEVNGKDEYFEINKGSLKFDNGYDGKVLIIIDTYLLKDYIRSEEELNRMKRKVMILKDSYDELSDYEKELLKKEYGEYSIFDPNTYKPIKEGDMKRYSTEEGELSGGTIGFQLNTESGTVGAYIYGKIAYKKKEGSSIRDGIWGLRNSFSENLKQVHQNVKISNRKRLMKGPIQKIVFCSISFLSYYSELMYYTVNYFDDLEWTGFYGYSIPLSKESRIWGIFQS